MAKDMTEESPLRLIIQFALPLLAGNLFQQTYNIVDAAIVGRFLGTEALASVGASSSVQFLVLGFAGRSVFSGVIEMFARSFVCVLFVKTYGFMAICFTDQAAWLSACLYIVPTCLYSIRKVEKNRIKAGGN